MTDESYMPPASRDVERTMKYLRMMTGDYDGLQEIIDLTAQHTVNTKVRKYQKEGLKVYVPCCRP